MGRTTMAMKRERMKREAEQKRIEQEQQDKERRERLIEKLNEDKRQCYIEVYGPEWENEDFEEDERDEERNARKLRALMIERGLLKPRV